MCITCILHVYVMLYILYVHVYSHIYMYIFFSTILQTDSWQKYLKEDISLRAIDYTSFSFP